jgi:hypothetical protein
MFRQHDERFATLEKAAIESANQAIRALLLLNGGASIALLGFLSTTFRAEMPIVQQDQLTAAILVALRDFGIGAGLAVTLATMAYIINSLYSGAMIDYSRHWEHPHLRPTPASERKWRFGTILSWLAVLLGFGSLGCFFGGLYRLATVYT